MVSTHVRTREHARTPALVASGSVCPLLWLCVGGFLCWSVSPPPSGAWREVLTPPCFCGSRCRRLTPSPPDPGWAGASAARYPGAELGGGGGGAEGCLAPTPFSLPLANVPAPLEWNGRGQAPRAAEGRTRARRPGSICPASSLPPVGSGFSPEPGSGGCDLAQEERATGSTAPT